VFLTHEVGPLLGVVDGQAPHVVRAHDAAAAARVLRAVEVAQLRADERRGGAEDGGEFVEHVSSAAFARRLRRRRGPACERGRGRRRRRPAGPRPGPFSPSSPRSSPKGGEERRTNCLLSLFVKVQGVHVRVVKVQGVHVRDGDGTGCTRSQCDGTGCTRSPWSWQVEGTGCTCSR